MNDYIQQVDEFIAHNSVTFLYTRAQCYLLPLNTLFSQKNVKDILLSLICLPESWHSHMDDNWAHSLLINWSRKIWLEGRETSIFSVQRSLKSVKAISGRKKATEMKTKPNWLVIHILFRSNTNSLNIIKDFRYLADQNCLDPIWLYLSDFKLWFLWWYVSLFVCFIRKMIYTYHIQYIGL